MHQPDQPKRLPIDAAATALGLSRRTIERRLAAGTLSGVKDRGRWLVDVTEPPPHPGPNVAGLEATVLTLTTQLAERDHRIHDLEADAAQLQHHLQDLEDERDYLRQAHAASLTAMQRLLPAPQATKPPEPEPPRLRWPWQRPRH